MKISLTCLRPRSFASLALALAVSGSINALILVCAPNCALAQNSEISRKYGDENNATRPRRIDSADPIGPDGPLIRVGLLIDVAAVSLNSGSELIVRRARADDRDGYTVASGEMRVEARRIVAPALAQQKTPSKSDIKSVATDREYKPRTRYTEATSKETIKKSPEKASSSIEKGNNSLITHVVAFESNQMVASSESLLIVTASEEEAAQIKKDSDTKTDPRAQFRRFQFHPYA